MREAETYSSHDSQVNEGSSPNQGSDGGSTPHKESSQPPSEEGASLTSPGGQPLKCTVSHCSTTFTLEQARKRHYVEQHSDQPRLICPKCSQEWIREYERRKHLKRKHKLKDDEITELLGPPKQRRAKGKVIESDPSPYSSPPPIELAVGEEANHASQLLMPHVEPEVTTIDSGHEDSSGLKHHGATHAPPGFLSGEGFAQLVIYHITHGEFRLPSVHPGGSTTADVVPNPGIPHIPSPFGGHYSSPVSGGAMIEPSGSMDPIYTPVADSTSADASSWLGPVGDLDPYQ